MNIFNILILLLVFGSLLGANTSKCNVLFYLSGILLLNYTVKNWWLIVPKVVLNWGKTTDLYTLESKHWYLSSDVINFSHWDIKFFLKATYYQNTTFKSHQFMAHYKSHHFIMIRPSFSCFCHFNHHICSNLHVYVYSTWCLVHDIIISTFWLPF